MVQEIREYILDISAKITEICYSPLLCDNLKEYDFDCLEEALSDKTAFILNKVNEITE